MAINILFIGDDERLLATRAELLRNWHVMTTSSQRALDEIDRSDYDVLIFCQTISNEVARKLAQAAMGRRPGMKILALACGGQDRPQDWQQYDVSAMNPKAFVRTVSSFLGGAPEDIPSATHS